MQGQKLHKIDDGRINELLARTGLSLLLITSSWDGQGVIMRTLLEGLAERYQKVSFTVAEVEDSPLLCKVFNVTNPPGLLFIRDGELVDRLQGAVGGNAIMTAIEQIA